MRAPRASTPAEEPQPLGDWLRRRAGIGAIANVVTFVVLAATAASRAAHGVLSPAGLVAVVVGATFAATTTGWIAGLYEGADAAVNRKVLGARPATADLLAGWHPWSAALRWTGASCLWSAAGAVLLAAVLRDRSAPFPVLVVALVALAAPAAVAVDAAARAAGASVGTALLRARPPEVSLLRRSWRDLALPLAGVQVLVNAGAAWVLLHGDAAQGTLTRDAAFADALVLAALLAGLFGALGAKWGALDAAVERIPPPEGASAKRHPIGPQALVYAAGLTLLLISGAGLVVPSTPSLLRVAIVRGLVAGGLVLVACALGVVRGAGNAAVLDLDPERPRLPAHERRRAPRSRRARASVLPLAGAGAAALLLGLFAAAPVAKRAQAQELPGLGLVAELDALGVRVEYDIPAPASSGSAPQVVGSARRSSGSEAANGIAAAPSRLDPVVGGSLSNADKKPASGDEVALPQAECAHPGALADVAFAFPADLRPETAGAPALGWSTAQCGAGPAVELHAAMSPDRSTRLGPAVSVGGGAGDGTAGPSRGVLSATASAKATAVSILDGVIEVDSVVASGSSRTDGGPGGASTEANVDVTGVSVAGMRFDLRGGDLVVGGQRLPVGGSAASAFLDALDTALAPSGCRITVLDSPAAYPQGFLFSRPQPELGLADDGSLAASMRGGLLVQCEMPEALGTTTGFNPQRLQVMLGFVYTGVSAHEDIGGFGLGDVGAGAPEGGVGDGLALPGTSAIAELDLAQPAGPSTPDTSPTNERSPAGSDEAASGPLMERVRLLAANFAEGRPWLWGAALLIWLALTHISVEHVRRNVSEAVA